MKTNNYKQIFVTNMLVLILIISGCSKSTNNSELSNPSDSPKTNTTDTTNTTTTDNNKAPQTDSDDNTPLGFVSDSPDENGKRVVIVKGTGSDYDNAKKDAMKNAVREVINALVTLETRASLSESITKNINNYEIFVEQCEILSRKQGDGLIDIKAQVVVQQKSLQTQLLPSEVSVKTFDGASIAKKLTEKIKSDNDAVMLVADFLRSENFPYSCIDAAAELNPTPVKTVGKELTMELKVTLTSNENKFNAFSKKIIPILEKIKINSGTLILEGTPGQGKSVGFELPDNLDKSYLRCNIFTSSNKSLKNTNWNYYDLPPKFKILFAAYQCIIICADVSVNNNNNEKILSLRRPFCNTQLIKSKNFYQYYFDNCIRILLGDSKKKAILYDSIKTGSTSMFEDKHLNPYGIDPNNPWGRSSNSDEIRARRDAEFSLYRFNEEHKNIADSIYIMLFPWSINEYSDHKGYTYFNPNRSWSETYTITITAEELSSVKSVTCRVMSENSAMEEFYKKLPELLKKFAN
ncbi:MAG: hypothetical protein LBE12_10345 [Planctomycetaceae bacterium]|nr:hypothetical protein [Planctomycetaceae bacterium]